MPELTQEYLITFLKNVSFFSELQSESIARLVTDFKSEIFRKGTTIFDKGDQGDAMYVILEGHVTVHDGDHILSTLAPYDCFGEYALIDNEDRSASATAKDQCLVLIISRDHFLELMTSDSGFAQGVLSVMIKRHRELDQTQEQLARSKNDLEMASTKMKGLINGAMDSIIMFNHKLRIVLTNPSANLLLENTDALQRNVLSFFDEASAAIIEDLLSTEDESNTNTHLPNYVRVIGSDGTITTNEGTLSKHSTGDDIFYTLILRNIEDKLKAEDTINLLTNQRAYLEEEIKELTSSYGIIAQDLGMKNVLNLIDQVASTDATVLITGETGTGKELVARAIHKASQRNDKPLIRVNCGAIPTNLIESELFGHKKGAFTGAINDRKGRFLLADKGSIFLDEIGELPLELQPKLLYTCSMHT